MMKKIAALALLLCLICSTALAKDPTPTPPPIEIGQEVLEPPAMIQNMLDIAYTEWETLDGATLKKSNKYTKWRNNGQWGWCGGFITWCMLEAGVPQEEMDFFVDAARESEDGFYHTQGIVHVKEAAVPRLLRGYQTMNRTTYMPQPGYLLVYGCDYNKTIHIGLVYDVQSLGDGKFRLTTLEGNMSNRVKMYIHDYDMYAEDLTKNLSEVPEAERVREASVCMDYSIAKTMPSDRASKQYTWNVTCFLMPWVPDDEVNAETTPTPPAK